MLSGAGVPTVYVSGDNTSIEVVRAVSGRFGTIDVAVLFAGAAKVPLLGDACLTLTGAQAVQAALILGAATIVPVHCHGWSHLTEGTDDLRTAFAAARLSSRLALLAPGRAASLCGQRQPGLS